MIGRAIAKPATRAAHPEAIGSAATAPPGPNASLSEMAATSRTRFCSGQRKLQTAVRPSDSAPWARRVAVLSSAMASTTATANPGEATSGATTHAITAAVAAPARPRPRQAAILPSRLRATAARSCPAEAGTKRDSIPGPPSESDAPPICTSARAMANCPYPEAPRLRGSRVSSRT